MKMTREFVIVENKRQVCLLNLTADTGVETNAELTPICQLRVKNNTGIQSCLYAVTLTFFCVNFLTYIV